MQVLTEHVTYVGKDGQQVTESFEAFSGENVRKVYRSLDEFLQRWNAAERKEAVWVELIEQGLLLAQIEEKLGTDLDPFHLICHVAYGEKPLTRSERACNVKRSDVYASYGATARQVLDSLLDKYADEGIALIFGIGLLNWPAEECGSKAI